MDAPETPRDVIVLKEKAAAGAAFSRALAELLALSKDLRGGGL